MILLTPTFHKYNGQDNLPRYLSQIDNINFLADTGTFEWNNSSRYILDERFYHAKTMKMKK
jgi:hypothetical protein